MKKMVMKCLKCEHEFISNKDGLRCPKTNCFGAVVPLREATKEDTGLYQEVSKNISSTASIKNTAPPKAKEIKSSEENVVVLKQTTLSFSTNKVDEIEEKYSKKFGCKVIILEYGLDFAREEKKERA